MKKSASSRWRHKRWTRLFRDNNSGRLDKGDAAMLRFAAAAEILESDSGSSTTSWAASKIVKCRVGMEFLPTPPRFKTWTLTSRST
jgi:hypothetical protein